MPLHRSSSLKRQGSNRCLDTCVALPSPAPTTEAWSSALSLSLISFFSGFRENMGLATVSWDRLSLLMFTAQNESNLRVRCICSQDTSGLCRCPGTPTATQPESSRCFVLGLYLGFVIARVSVNLLCYVSCVLCRGAPSRQSSLPLKNPSHKHPAVRFRSFPKPQTLNHPPPAPAPWDVPPCTNSPS